MGTTWIIVGVCLSVCLWKIQASTKIYYMEEKCGEIINMATDDADSIQLQFTKSERYENDMDCVLRIMAPENKRLIIKIDRLDIQWEENCSADYLQMFDGTSLNGDVIDGLNERVCSSANLRRGYTSKERFVTLKFRSDSENQGTGFTILFTAFRTDDEGICYNTEFTCESSGRCISSRLICDGYDNCFDDSDECRLSTPTIIGISVGCGVIVVAVIGMIVCCCVWKRRQRNRHRDSNKDEVVTDDVSSAARLYRPSTFRRPVYTVPSVPPDYRYSYVNPDPAFIQPIYIRQYPDYSTEYAPSQAWLTAPNADRHYAPWYD